MNSVAAETECAPNALCTVGIAPPSGVQPGDLLLINLRIGAVSSSNPTLPTGWTLLPISNLSTPNKTVFQMQSSDSCGFVVSTWMAAHVYQGGESLYKFSHFNNGVSTCVGNSSGELVAFIADYRGTTQNPSNLIVYGSPSKADGSSFTTLSVTPPAETTLTAFVGAPGEETESGDDLPTTVSAPTGTPTMIAETPLTFGGIGLLVADAAVLTGGTSYGGYTVTQTSPQDCSSGTAGCLWIAFEIAIPE